MHRCKLIVRVRARVRLIEMRRIELRKLQARAGARKRTAIL